MGRMADVEERSTRRRPGAERLLETASDLFYREGIRAVGVDTVSERAGVSKRTLYNRFGGKDARRRYPPAPRRGWKAYCERNRSRVEPKESSWLSSSVRGVVGGEDFGLRVRQPWPRSPDRTNRPESPGAQGGIEEHLARTGEGGRGRRVQDPRKAAALC